MLEIWPVTLIGALHTDLAYLSACLDSRCPLRCAPVPATNDTFRSFSYAFYLYVCVSVLEGERVSWEIIEWRFSIFPYPNNSNYLMHIYNRLVANSVAFPFSFSISIWISPLPHLFAAFCTTQLSVVSTCFVALTICSGFACQMNYLCFSFQFFCFFLWVHSGAKWNTCGLS